MCKYNLISLETCMELLMCILQLLQEHGSIERARLIDMFTKNLSAMDFNGCSSGARACCYAAMCSGTDRMKQDVKVMFNNGEC